jgi:hypothetical protein
MSQGMPAIELQGIIYKNGNYHAVIEDVTVSEGSIVKGYHVRRIWIDGVELEGNGKTLVLTR